MVVASAIAVIILVDVAGPEGRGGCGKWISEGWCTVCLVNPASNLVLLADVGVVGLWGEVVFGHG